MHRSLIGALLAVLMGVSCGFGRTLTGIQDWAEVRGDDALEQLLTNMGLRKAEDRAAVKADWDEDVFVETALAHRAYPLIVFALSVDGLSRAARDRIKAAVLSEDPHPIQILEMAIRYPAEESGDFREALYALLPRRYSRQPVLGRMVIEYTALQNIYHFGPDVPVNDLVRVLLADEPLDTLNVQRCKDALKDRAVVLARRKLREEGSSFVVRNGVNPLAAKVQPVVDALNAPLCVGLEDAFRNLGAEVEDADRAALKAGAEEWRDQILFGEVLSANARPLLGKLSVALGPDGFNRFVDEYNNGGGGGE